MLNCLDLFLLASKVGPKNDSPSTCDLPPVEATHLVSFLVLETSFVTAKQFKAHKSMEAYNRFVSGRVIHIERVLPDHDFWLECVKKCTEFVNFCILPELLGRWCTRPCISSNSESSAQAEPSSTSTPSHTEAAKKYCNCQCLEQNGEEMIACDFPNCAIEWYHTRCLKIKSIPNGKWYCPTCRK